MRRLLAGLLIVVALLVLCAAPALAQTPTSLPAKVTVTSYISFLVTDAGSTGIDFGSGAPNTTGINEVAQSEFTPAVTLVVKKETNIPVNVQIKAGGEFLNGSKSIALTNATWGDSPSASRIAMTSEWANVATSVMPSDSDLSFKVWHWLTIPAGAAGGDYATTYVYQASQ